MSAPASEPETFEYVCVFLTGRVEKDGDRRWTEQINNVAVHGWRLVTITENTATFERRRA
jgi:hypothetical protein